MIAMSSILERFHKPGTAPQDSVTPKENVLSVAYQRKVIKAIHDAEAQEMAEREASAAELRKGNAIGAKRRLQMAKVLQNDRLQADVKNGQAIVCSITDKIRDLIPEQLELPATCSEIELDPELHIENEVETISVEMMRELEANARAMEEREQATIRVTHASEKERLMEVE